MITIDGKYYEECDVIMLPVKEKPTREATTYPSDIALYNGKLYFHNNLEYDFLEAEFQHLYFTSPEKIKVGDWYTNGKNIFQCKNLKDVDKERYNYLKKIIVTTDKLQILNDYLDDDGSKFYLPQIQMPFIKEYIDNPVSKTMVEYEPKRQKLATGEIIRGTNAYYNMQLKVDNYNLINIKPPKNSWNRDEVIEFSTNLRCFINESNRTIFEVDEWIKQNL
jgi:hypothetical protein